MNKFQKKFLEQLQDDEFKNEVLLALGLKNYRTVPAVTIESSENCAALKSEIEDKENIIKNITKEKDKTIDNLNGQIQSLQKKSSELQSKIEDDEKTIRKKDETIDNLKSELRKNKDIILGNSGTINGLKSDNRTLHSDNERLKSDNQTLHSDNERLKSDNQTLHSDNERLKSDNRTLRSDNERLKSDFQRSKSEIRELTEENKRSKAETHRLEKKAEDISCQLKKYEENFIHSVSAYEYFIRLTDDVKQKLGGIIRATTVEAFICCISKESVMDSLWDYMRSMAVQGELTNDFKLLKELFAYSFTLVNLTYKEPVYGLLPVPAAGAKADDEFHIKCSGDPSIGYISDVLLMGYKNRQGKIIKKTVVKCR